MYIQGWHMLCGKGDMMSFMLRNWIGKDGLMGDHCFKATSIQRNDVKIITFTSAYCQRNDEEPFGVFVDSLVTPLTCALNRKNKRNRPNNAVR